MKKTKLRLATTHLDRRNERFSIEALESMVKQSNEGVIPLGSEHDPRIAPLGRIIHTELVELEDGEYAVEGIAEIYEGNFEELEDLGIREIPVREYHSGSYNLVVDRNFRDEESQKDIQVLQKILNNAETKEEIKKALDPISILTIGGAFVLGGIANGFLGGIGSDAYEALKKKLKEIFSKPIPYGQEKLFTFDTTITNGNHSVNVEVILTNPSVDDIQEFFDQGIKQLDQISPRHFNKDNGFARIVFEYKEQNLNLKFAVKKDGIPVYPK